MIPTFIIDTPILLVLGLVLAQCEPNRANSRFIDEPAFAYGFGLTLMVAAVAFGQFAVAPGWMVGYYVDDPTFTVEGLAYLLLVLHVAPFVAAYALGTALRARSRVRGFGFALLAIAAQVAVVSHEWARYWFVTDSAILWRAGQATPMPEHGTLNAVGLGGAGVILVCLALAIRDALKRFRAAREPLYNPVEREILADAVAQWYGLSAAEARSAAERTAAYLADTPPEGHAFLKVGLALLQWSPLFVIGRPSRFTALPPHLQVRHLARIERSNSRLWRFAMLAARTVSGVLHFEAKESALSANPACSSPRP